MADIDIHETFDWRIANYRPNRDAWHRYYHRLSHLHWILLGVTANAISIAANATLTMFPVKFDYSNFVGDALVVGILPDTSFSTQHRQWDGHYFHPPRTSTSALHNRWVLNSRLGQYWYANIVDLSHSIWPRDPLPPLMPRKEQFRPAFNSFFFLFFLVNFVHFINEKH